MKLLIDTHKKDISCVLSCYDRIIITGTIPEISHHQGMTAYMYRKGIKIFDYPKFAELLTGKVRDNAERIAKENGLAIEFISKSGIRKESIIAEKIKERGGHPGIVHIISVMETCNTYKPWHDKQTGRTFLKPSTSKCLHYYFYFIDSQLGLGYVRVPTWCPFRLQVYINGHNLLASEMEQAGINYTIIDNAFDSLQDAHKAQELSDNLNVEKLHKKLDELGWWFCPVYKDFDQRYHWSVMQAEYATDIVFKNQRALQQFYSVLIAFAIHSVKPDNIATFLGHKLDPRYEGEAGNNYHVRIQGSRIKHTMGKVSIKMYDKFSKILRIETTVNDISFFKHYRQVEHRDGTKSNKMAPIKKNIYSLTFLAENLKSANKRYLEFISAFDNKETGRNRLEKITSSKCKNNRKYKGFNFFSKDDLAVLMAILRGEFNISGFRNKNLQKLLGFKGSKISRLIKRLTVHKLIKKAVGSYKYYVTKLGKETIVMAQKIKEMVLVPAFCY